MIQIDNLLGNRQLPAGERERLKEEKIRLEKIVAPFPIKTGRDKTEEQQAGDSIRQQAGEVI